MKYFLALRKWKSNKYISIDLDSINNLLCKDNNLKALSKFTMTFKNETELKEFLIAKKLLHPNLRHNELKIAYNYKTIRFLNVPFKEDEKLFDIGYLAKTITDNSMRPYYLETFLEYFIHDNYLSEEFFKLSEALADHKTNYKLYDLVLSFINSKCYKIRNGKEIFSYKELFRIVMVVKALNMEMYKPLNEEKTEQVVLESGVLSEEALFKKEELEDRAKQLSKEIDGQLSLFHM